MNSGSATSSRHSRRSTAARLRARGSWISAATPASGRCRRSRRARTSCSAWTGGRCTSNRPTSCSRRRAVDPSRYRFEEANIFTHDFAGQFDIVLCLGLMYHISKPVELFEIFDGVGADVLVIDTSVSFAPSSFFEVSLDRNLDDPRNAVDYEIVLVPNRGALTELAALFGFKTVCLAHNMTDYTGMHDYGSDAAWRSSARREPRSTRCTPGAAPACHALVAGAAEPGAARVAARSSHGRRCSTSPPRTSARPAGSRSRLATCASTSMFRS